MSSTPETPDVPATPRNRLTRWLLWPVVATVSVVAGVSFLLSFQSQTELAIAARIRPDVAFGLPIVIDGTILVSTFAALILQPRGWKVAWYPWATLAVFGGTSIWSNGIHATGATLTDVELFLVGSIPAVGLLVSTHMLALLFSYGGQPTATAAAPAATAPLTVATPPVELTPAKPAVAAPRTRPNVRPNVRPAVVAAERNESQAGKVDEPDEPSPKAVPEKPLTRSEAARRIRSLMESGEQATGFDVASWMNITPTRGHRILDQITAEIKAAA